MNQISDERRAMRRANAMRDTLTVLAILKTELPNAWELAEVVGQWVWIEFPSKPDDVTREALLDMGFHWNQKRVAWQHACGKFSHHTNGNPRWKYMTVAAAELETVAA